MEQRTFYRLEKVDIKDIETGDKFIIREPSNKLVVKQKQFIFTASNSAIKYESGWGVDIKLEDTWAEPSDYIEPDYNYQEYDYKHLDDYMDGIKTAGEYIKGE